MYKFLCKTNYNEQYNHSIISSYPINYYKFPLAKNCKFIEIDLLPNEYVFIPAKWMHWVFTEPYNISMNFFIDNYDYLGEHKNDSFCKQIKDKIPFKNKSNTNLNFTYKDFLTKNLDNKFNILYSNSSHCAPVVKPYCNKNIFVKNNSIKEYLSSDYKNYYTYAPQCIINDPILNNIENFIDNSNIKIKYRSFIWINFDKKIDSGLHYDDYDNILFNIVGNKKVLLAKPEDCKYMYFKNMSLIK